MRYGSGVLISEECLNKTNMFFKIKFNNFLQGIERKMQQAFHKKDSFLNRLFMKGLPSTNLVQAIIIKGIKKKDFLLIRFGLYEYQLCYQYLEKSVGIRKEYSNYISDHIHTDAGIVWQSMVDLDDYAKFIIENLKMVDVIAYWRNYPSKLVFNDFYKKEVKHINVEDLYPFPFWHNALLPYWQNELKGKRVLLVTSFSDTVIKQYSQREKIWENADDILPSFNLITFQSVCTNGGQYDARFKSWREAVLYMRDEIKKIECDIILISCGGYGIPLSIELKKMKKTVIQWGGCYQLWFGIKGARWENVLEIKKYFNKYWVYPSELETPPNARKVDGSCYWKNMV